jgi:hypothetical protein
MVQGENNMTLTEFIIELDKQNDRIKELEAEHCRTLDKLEYLELQYNVLHQDWCAQQNMIKILREEREALEGTQRQPSKRGRW